MKKNWYCCLALLAWLNTALAAHPDQHDINTFLRQHQLPANSLTLVTLPLPGNSHSNGISYNASHAVNPASLIKLVTTYAALELLGPDYQWQTELLADGQQNGTTLEGNLYFRAGGDPRLSLERLWLLLRELKLQGIRHIEGDLILDDSFYLYPQQSGYQDSQGNRYRPYMVEPSSLLINFNSQHFRVTGTSNGATIISDPPIDSVSIDNRVKVLPQGNCNGRKSIVYHPQYSNGLASMRISGSIPRGCSTSRYFSLLPHERYAADTIHSIWQGMGGSISGQLMSGNIAGQLDSLATLPSVTMSEVIRDINKFSNNAMAKQLFLTIGAEHRNGIAPDDQQMARTTINSWWASKGLDANGLAIINGSGLSQQARLNAQQLASMLAGASQSPFYPELASSLPIVAIDGTMRDRLKHSQVQAQARIKTGTLRNVRAIAGYVRDKDANPWVIVAIINHEKMQLPLDVLDSLLETLYLQQPAKQ